MSHVRVTGGIWDIHVKGPGIARAARSVDDGGTQVLDVFVTWLGIGAAAARKTKH